MTNFQAILIGAALIGGGVLASGGLTGAAKAGPNGPYQLMHHSNTQANAGVFRLDSSNGAVSYCYINASQALTCTGEIR